MRGRARDSQPGLSVGDGVADVTSSIPAMHTISPATASGRDDALQPLEGGEHLDRALARGTLA